MMRTRVRLLSRHLLIVVVLASLVAACGKKPAGSRSVAAAVSVPIAPRRSLPPLPSRALTPRLQALRARAMEAAARTRGLEWQSDVGMTELSGWEYGTRTKEIADVLGTDDLKGMSELAIAGGILPEGTDLASLAVTFTAATAGATYSPLDKQVLLLTEGAKGGAHGDGSLLTHEFTHALQDQHFDLLRMLLVRPFNFDRTEADFALIEGDAMNVQRRTEAGDAWARRSLEDIWRQEDERFEPYRKQIGALFPPLLTETFIFRYRDGARFVEAMRRNRPAVSADELFRRPPQSSEQVLHPEKYLSNEAPREVDANEAGFASEGWRASASTPLGEIGVRGLLMAGVPVAESRRAASGWGGDRAYVFEQTGHAPLFLWKTAWDRDEDAQEFFRAYRALQRSRGATEAGNTSGTEQHWREGALLTLVRIERDTVIVIRGAEADAFPALDIASQRQD
ncbi:MAG: hypothetical protein LC754_12390 [Acidobacteria bacterium]|nr:hypothetical protein [Acidobacteriota bacterium]